jgi:hypothetical protein
MSATAHAPVTSPARTWSRRVLVGLEVLIAASAVYGGVGLIRDGLGMPDEWLVGTPFDTWVLPGVFLLLVIAVPMVCAAAAELSRSRWAFWISLVAAASLVGWIVVQIVVIQRFFFLQPALAAAGLAIAALALRSRAGHTDVGGTS